MTSCGETKPHLRFVRLLDRKRDIQFSKDKNGSHGVQSKVETLALLQAFLPELVKSRCNVAFLRRICHAWFGTERFAIKRVVDKLRLIRSCGLFFSLPFLWLFPNQTAIRVAYVDPRVNCPHTWKSKCQARSMHVLFIYSRIFKQPFQIPQTQSAPRFGVLNVSAVARLG